jgi:hypothetical protein
LIDLPLINNPDYSLTSKAFLCIRLAIIQQGATDTNQAKAPLFVNLVSNVLSPSSLMN